MDNITNIEETKIADAVETVIEPSKKFSKFGIGAAIFGAVAALGYGIYRMVTDKQEDDGEETIDNVEVAKRDFLDDYDE